MVKFNPKQNKRWIRACVNLRAKGKLTSCGAKGSRELVAALKTGIELRRLPWNIELVHCMGKCHLGPTMKVLPDGCYIMGASETDVPRILDLLEIGDIKTIAEAFPMPPEALVC